MKTLLLILVLMEAGCAMIKHKPVVVDRMTCSDGSVWILLENDWVYTQKVK